MNNYWMCITDLNNYKITISENIWGVRTKYEQKLKKLELNDNVIFYITRKKIGGVFKIASEVYKDNNRVFSGGIYPYRIKLKPVKIPKNTINFTDEMIKDLDMFKYKDFRWKYELMGQIIKSISKKDFEYLISKF